MLLFVACPSPPGSPPLRSPPALRPHPGSRRVPSQHRRLGGRRPRLARHRRVRQRRDPHAQHRPAGPRRASGCSYAFGTTPQCSPSRISILTGQYPHATRAEDLHTPLPDGERILPSYLQAGGYFTGMMAKTHYRAQRRAAVPVVLAGDRGRAARVPRLGRHPAVLPLGRLPRAPSTVRRAGAIAHPHAPARCGSARTWRTRPRPGRTSPCTTTRPRGWTPRSAR